MIRTILAHWRARREARRRASELEDARMDWRTARAAWLDAKARRDTRDMARHGEVCRAAMTRVMGLEG